MSLLNRLRPRHTDSLQTSSIRYAAPPVGPRRFREPQVPAVNRTAPQRAWSDPAACPQSAPQLSNASFLAPLLPTGATGEDCLYLNVFAPKNAHNLPVFVWIHGGGYELGAASTYDPSPLIHTNNGSFIAVVIQYRLGAFGFLSGDEVKHKGALNSGLLDQQLTLHWVQKYIKLFGGDPKRVTIAGESAGAGSVMNHAIAYGGSQGSRLWTNVSICLRSKNPPLLTVPPGDHSKPVHMAIPGLRLPRSPRYIQLICGARRLRRAWRRDV